MARGIPVRAKKMAPAEELSYEEVAQVAYELFVRHGSVHGHDQEDWLEAERIVRVRQRTRAGR